MVIEDVTAANGRVVIRFDEFTLVVTETTELKRCELPAVWLKQSVIHRSGKYLLEITTDTGRMSVIGADFRLLRNLDLAMLVPPVDAS